MPKLKVRLRLNLHGLVSIESVQQVEEEEYEEVVEKPAAPPAKVCACQSRACAGHSDALLLLNVWCDTRSGLALIKCSQLLSTCMMQRFLQLLLTMCTPGRQAPQPAAAQPADEPMPDSEASAPPDAAAGPPGQEASSVPQVRQLSELHLLTLLNGLATWRWLDSSCSLCLCNALL